jgi:hypothetical protein
LASVQDSNEPISISPFLRPTNIGASFLPIHETFSEDGNRNVFRNVGSSSTYDSAQTENLLIQNNRTDGHRGMLLFEEKYF